MSKGKFQYCDMCQVPVTGKEQYEQHLAGQKHAKKLKLLGLPSNTVSQSSPNTTVGTPVSGYRGKFVTPSKSAALGLSPGGQFTRLEESPQQQQPAHNMISKTPPVQKAAANQQSAPNKTKQRRNQNVTSSACLAPPPPPPASLMGLEDPIMLQGNNDPVMNAVKANLMGNLPTKKEAYDGKCAACNVRYTSKSHEIQHLSGKKHAKKTEFNTDGNNDPGTNTANVTLMENLPTKTNTDIAKCAICNVRYTSKSHQIQHLSGKKHAKKAELFTDGTNVNTATLFCGFCNIQVNAVSQMDQHVSGAIHQKNVQKAKAKQKRAAADHENGPSPAKKACPSPSEPYIPPMIDPSQLRLEPLSYDK